MEALNQLGVANLLRAFIYSLPGRDVASTIKTNGREFHFYPTTDKGVVSHFYKLGNRICGTLRLIVDVGAYIGDEVFRFRHFHPTAKTVAIEPALRNHRLLCRSLQSDPDTTLIHGALWSESCQPNLSSSDAASREGYSLTHPDRSSLSEDHSEAVRGYTMQEILKANNLTNAVITIFFNRYRGRRRVCFLPGRSRLAAAYQCDQHGNAGQ